MLRDLMCRHNKLFDVCERIIGQNAAWPKKQQSFKSIALPCLIISTRKKCKEPALGRLILSGNAILPAFRGGESFFEI